MFNPYVLRLMSISDRQAFESLLKQVVPWGGDYYLETAAQQGFGRAPKKIGYRAVFNGTGAPPPTEYFYSPYDVLGGWHGSQIVVPKLDVGKELAYEFSQGVLTWYLENRQLSEHDIRVLLGRRLYRRFLDGSDSEEFDVDAIAQEFHLSADDIFNQSRVLIKLSYAKPNVSARVGTESSRPKPLTRSQQLNRFHLTEKGHQWVAAGYPVETIGFSPNLTVNIDLHVAVWNTIQEAQQSEVDQDTKDRFELLMRRVEAGLDKPEGKGSIQPLKDALEVATNAKGLLGPLVKFTHENWDKLQHLGGMMF